MLRVFGVRFFVIAAIVLAVGSAENALATSASSTSIPHQLQRLDLGDDDGDGIPNYLDPDDNNDGVADRDTPAVVPTPEAPPVEEPSVDDSVEAPEPVPQQEDEVPPPDTGVTETPVPITSPQVSSLPNTGVGFSESVAIAISPEMLLFLSVAGAGMLAPFLHLKRR